MGDERGVTVVQPQGFAQSLASIGPALGVLLAACYVCGYVIVNTHLAKYGITENDPLRAVYLSSGAVFILLHGLFFYLVIRRLANLNEDAATVRELQARSGRSGRWWGELAATWCVFASLGCGFFFVIFLSQLVLSPDPPMEKVTVLAMLGYGLGMTFFWLAQVSKAIVWITDITFLYVAALETLVSLVIYAYMTPLGSAIAFLFVGVGISANFLFAHRLASNKLHVTFLVCLYGLLGSALFGSTIYEYVRPSFGGGATPPVDVVLREQALPATWERFVNLTPDRTLRRARLLSETPTSAVLSIPFDSAPSDATVLKLEKTLIAAIVRVPEKRPDADSKGGKEHRP